jgi:hypothetical protein
LTDLQKLQRLKIDAELLTPATIEALRRMPALRAVTSHGFVDYELELVMKSVWEFQEVLSPVRFLRHAETFNADEPTTE